MALLATATGLWAQTPTPLLVPVEQPFDFYSTGEYREKLPRPETLLGYEPGEAYAQYGAFLEVLETYAHSDRVRVFPTGATNERRPMHVVAISSAKNLRRLDDIKAANQRLADGRAELSDREIDRLIAKQPIIVWLGYNIHGDEAAGTEAAIRVLYELVASESKTVKAWLDDVVVIMNPCQNPDGRERFVVWANAHGLGRPERFAYEKENPWNVQGRYNHYYFDLNRDMIPTSQVESRNSGAAFLEWLPQVAADHHGETKEFFFPPAALPINPNLPRESLERWLDVFGRGNAAAFDQQGWMYYVRDYFDIFYAGYWDSWPALQGATGMTYETSGGGKRGFNYLRDDETIMTLRSAIAKHFTASLATIATAAAHREARLRDFREHFVSAVKAGREADLQQVWIPAGTDPHRTRELVRALRRSGVEVQTTTAVATLPTATNYFGVNTAEITMPVGTFVVDMAQPKGHVARALLEPDTAIDDAFIERQQEKMKRNRDRGENAPDDDYEFYDVTAWTMPLAYDVEAYQVGAAVNFSGDVIGEVVAPSVAAPPRATAAYVIRPGTEGAVRLALDLLEEGYRVATAVRSMDVGGVAYPRGSLVVRIERNPTSLHERIGELARRHRIEVGVANTAFTESGITGIGSESTFALTAPKVLVATGDGVIPSSYGALHYLFEETYGLEFVPVAVDTLGSIDLRKFNVVVLPAGSPHHYGRLLGDGGKSNLKTWVSQGGTLICLGWATEFAIDADTGWTSIKRVGADDDDDAKADDADGEDEPDAEPLPVPGAMMRTMVDHDHFLSFGYEQDELPFLVNSDTFFTASETGFNVLKFPQENIRLAGYVWPDNTERLIGGTAAVVDEPVGRGHIILFSDEPGYRAWWHATTRMLMNAILYAPGLQNQTGGYSR